MKHIKVLLVSLLVLFTGCSSNQENVAVVSPSSEPSDTNITTYNQNNSLVVYFSATGNTKQVAQYISDYLDIESIELIPSEPYSNDDLNYNDDNSRVVKEHNDSSLQDIALENAVIDNWDSYSTIYIGYPIWWGDAAWPIYSFITSNDFTDKTVICFTTSASSQLGDSVNTLKNMANGGNWLDGIRFSSHVSEDEVIAWIDSLDE